VRPQVYQAHRAIMLAATAMSVSGTVERQGEVIHVMVREAEDLSAELPRLALTSRDFH